MKAHFLDAACALPCLDGTRITMHAARRSYYIPGHTDGSVLARMQRVLQG